MTNCLKGKYLLSKLFFRHKKTILSFFMDFNYLTDRFIIIIGRYYRSERIFFYRSLIKKRPKKPETVCRVSKINRNGLN
jgi:hypothetical protein